MNNQLWNNVSQYLNLSGLSTVSYGYYFHYVLEDYPCLNGDSDVKKVALYIADKPDLKDVCTLKVGTENKEFDEFWMVCSNEFDKENWNFSIREHEVQLYTETEFYFRVMRDLSLLTSYNQFSFCSELYTISSLRKISLRRDEQEEDLVEAIEATMTKYNNRMQLISDRATETFKVLINPRMESHFTINDEFSKVSKRRSWFICNPEIFPISESIKNLNDIDIEFVLQTIDPDDIWTQNKEEFYTYKI